MSDLSLTNLYTNYLKDGKVDKEEFKKVVDNVLKDGIIESEEAHVLYQIGKSLGDTKEFDINRLKKSDGSPIDKDVKELFKLGIKAREKENLLVEQAADTCEDTFGCILEGVAYVADALGFEDASNYLNQYNITDKEKQDIDKKLSTLMKSDLKYDKKVTDETKCLQNALKQIGKNSDLKFSNLPREAFFVNSTLLNQWTGKKWDEISLSEYQNNTKLNNLFDNNIIEKGKALLVDGSHTYVFDSYNKETGKITALDPSDKNKKVTFDVKNEVLSVFVMGKGDGNFTPNPKDFKNVRTFEAMKKESIKNDSDKKSPESFEMRKLFSFMADPQKAEKFDEFKTKVNNIIKTKYSKDSLSDLKSFLNNQDINLDNRELSAMSKILTTKTTRPKEIFVDTRFNPPKSIKVSSPLEMFDWINDRKATDKGKKPEERKMTNNQLRYMKGVQYSNVDLSNYFSESRDSKEKAIDMIDVFKKIMEGKIGC